MLPRTETVRRTYRDAKLDRKSITESNTIMNEQAREATAEPSVRTVETNQITFEEQAGVYRAAEIARK